jgi:anti-sigma-K factor RskA
VSDHERFLDLCAAFTAGALSPEERRELEEHLATGCAECEQALAAFHEGAAALALSAAAAEPPPALRARVFRAIEAEGARGQRGRLFAVAGWAVAACLAVIAFLGWQRQEEDAKRLAVLEASGARSAALAPQADFPGLLGRAVYDPATGRAVFVLENYHPPAGKDYELWAIRGGKPVSLGVARTDEAGTASILVADLGAVDALAISLEPAGGSKTGAPTAVVSVAALAG